MKLLTFNGSLKQKEHKQSVSTRKEKKQKTYFHMSEHSLTQGLY
jgi:hypothetical protein